MKTHKHRTWFFRTKFFKFFSPNTTCSTIFSDFFKEIIMSIEKETQPWCKLINIQTSFHRPFNILDAITNSECKFLNRCTSCLTNMVTRNTYCIPTRNTFKTIFKSINNKTHTWLRWKNPAFLSNILLQNIILNSPTNDILRYTSVFCISNVKRPDNSSRTINSHTGSNLINRNITKQNLHILQRRNCYTTFTKLTTC